MKKWWITLAVLALLLIPSVTLAEKEFDFFCFTCHAERTGIVSDTYEYSDSTYHVQRIQCTVCKNAGQVIGSRHTESIAATCQSAAYCDVCKSNYGAPAEHNWGAWQPNLPWLPNLPSNLHYRICQNADCGTSESEPHEGNANCVTSAKCSKCQATYRDTTNHAGPFTYTYEKYDESFHKRIETCTACGEKTGNQATTKHEENQADCISPAYCSLCKSNYGDPDPNNHVGETMTTYVKTSETQHTAKITYTVCDHTVDGESTDHTQTAAATCTDAAYCAVCKSSYGDPDPDGHVGTPTTTYAKTSETQHTPTTTYSICKHSVTGTPEAHTETTAATCVSGAYCGDCESNYGDPDPDAHDLESHDAQAPTCYKTGWDAYEACRREGCTYTTFAEKGTLVHWYGEWTPNADGTHSATCRYGCGYRRTVPCAPFTYQLNGDPVAEFTLCPVCGEVNDGTRLTMAEGARAAALTRTLPGGEVVVRVGVLSGGEAVMSVAFESAGCLTKPTGQVKVSLPAEWLEGYALRLLAADGTETELTFDVHKEEATFVLDFTDSPSAVRVIRLVPVA
ncbi:MAG: hypothetical protein ACI4MG_03810 [Aristaeellaceae bacterium]